MSALPQSESSLRRFRLTAAAEPGLLPRVLEPFAKRGLVPERLRAERRDDVLTVELLADLPAEIAPLLAASLGAIVGVTLLAAD
jgi:hypothetical protein